MFGGSGLSLADIAAVTNKNDGDGGFGGNNGWWILIILFALFGWGGNGFGGNGRGNECCERGGSNVTVVPMPYGGFGGGWGAFDAASLQRGFDTSGIIQKLDGITNGLCDLGYNQLAQVNGINQNVTQLTFGVMQQLNALSRQNSDCCCETKGLIRDVQYNLEKSDCSIKTLMNQLFQQLQWGEMQNAQMLSNLINQKFNDLTLQQKDAELASLRTQLAQCSDKATAQWIVNELQNALNPRAVPSYPASNPHGIGNLAPSVLAGGRWANDCDCGRGNVCC